MAQHFVSGTTASWYALIADEIDGGLYEGAEDSLRYVIASCEKSTNEDFHKDLEWWRKNGPELEASISAAKAADKNHVPPK